MRQQLEGGQSAASVEVEHLKEQLQQMTVTMETQQKRWVYRWYTSIVCVCVYVCFMNDSSDRYNNVLVGNVSRGDF